MSRVAPPFLPVLLFSMLACGGGPADPPPGPPPPPVPPTVKDCVGAGCPSVVVPGDPYQQNPDFFGYADPSVRKDPTSDAIWLSYSFPHYASVGGVPVPSVSIHLARSTDGGRSWSFVKQLFDPVPMANPANPGQQGLLDHETINLAPVVRGGVRTWAAARLNYFIPGSGGFGGRPSSSFHISVVTAATPEALTDGPVARIGATLTDAAWNVDASLVPPELQNASFFWNEPALHYDAGRDRLYLVMVAFVYEGARPVMERNEVYVYATTPAGDPRSWSWTYKGKLVSDAVAGELGGERVTQTDLAVGQDGRLLLVLTPDDWNAARGDFNHKGGKVVEIASLETPALARDGNGNLRVLAVITASDANDLGSGASAYERAAETGLLFTKRVKTTSSLTASIHATGLRP